MPMEVSTSGQTGGVLVVYPTPTSDEDVVGRPFSSDAAAAVRAMIGSHWDGPVAFVPAVRCCPGSAFDDSHVEACRPYLRSAVRDLKPERILCFGTSSAHAVLGRKLRPFDARRAYSYTSDGVAVFTLFHPVEAATNRFVARWLRRDVESALTSRPPVPPFNAGYEMVETRAEALGAAAMMRAARWIVNDVETAGVMWEPGKFKVSCTSVTTDSLLTFVWSEEALDDPTVAGPLVDVLEDPDVPTGGQNFKYDVAAWAADKRDHVRCRVKGVYSDTLLWRKMFESDASASLDVMSELVGMGGAKDEAKAALKVALDQIHEARSKAKKGWQAVPGLVGETLQWATEFPDVDALSFAYGLLDPTVKHRYCARDTVVTAMLTRLYEERIEKAPTARRVWNVLLQPATSALARVQEWGFAADRKAVEAFSDYLSVHLVQLRRRLMQWGEFNPASSQSVARHLYQVLGLPVVKTTKLGGAPSTDKEALKALRSRHPIVPLLEEFRETATMKNRYADGMSSFIRGDGRVHGSLMLDGTRSGRLSSRDPNLQNIPSGSGRMAKMAKNVFVAPPGRILIQLDYSQLEYRVAAILSGDPVFQQVFVDGHDLHRRTAELIAPIVWGIDPSKVTKEDHRRPAKIVNFGLFYGMGDEALAAMLGCSVAQARKVREAVLGQFKVVDKWIDEQIADAEQNGVTWTYWAGERARMRQLWLIASQDGKLSSRARNGSFNTPVQGSAADYCLRSLCEIVDWIDGDNLSAMVTNTVHDSIILESDEADVLDVALTAKEIMESQPTDGVVPLVADADVGWSWGSLVDLDKALGVAADLKSGCTVDDVVDSMRDDNGNETVSRVQVIRFGDLFNGNAT